MNPLRIMGLNFHSPLTSFLDTGRITPSTQRAGDQIGPHNWSGHFEENEKSLTLLGDRTANRLPHTIVTVTTTSTRPHKQWPGLK